MKTLIINGSPRAEGNTIALVHELSKHLSGEIDIINSYYDNIKPCVDCRHCWTNACCALGDSLYQRIERADNIVIASPVYFSQLSGALLNLATRLQYYYTSKFIRNDEAVIQKRKKGILILTAGGNGSHIPAVETARILFKCVNAEFMYEIYSLNTDVVCAQDDVNAKKQAIDCIEML